LAKTFRLEFRARLDNLAEIRDFVGVSALELGLGAAAVEDMKVCVDEAATNIVKHGYGSDEGGLSVEVSREADEIVVKVVDQAPPFDPRFALGPDLDAPLNDRPVGGMGVHLIRTLTDGMSHTAGPTGGNELVLRKKVAGAS
jgi:serine/threonine-protein kinase RsbW